MPPIDNDQDLRGEEDRGPQAVDRLLLPTPWTAHTAFSLQARVALQRNYAAGVDPAHMVMIARRQDALRRWRGLGPDAG